MQGIAPAREQDAVLHLLSKILCSRQYVLSCMLWEYFDMQDRAERSALLCTPQLGSLSRLWKRRGEHPLRRWHAIEKC